MMSQAYLPAMRQLVAARLRSQGLSQSRISGLLGTTQASVSHYLSASPTRAYALLSKFSMSEEEADAKAALLADAVRAGPADGVGALYSVWTALLGSGAACGYHRELYPSLADCDVCIRELGGRGASRSDLVAEVAQAVALIEESPHFVKVMPEVSVNIAFAAADAASPDDVVAVPGRIVRVKDRAKALLPPEAGASTHVSRVLLVARDNRPELRACINVSYDRRMSEVMRKHRLRVLFIGPYSQRGGGDSTTEALRRRLRSNSTPFDAVVDEGGSGIEPNVYLFSTGARAVAELALKLARSYSAA